MFKEERIDINIKKAIYPSDIEDIKKKIQVGQTLTLIFKDGKSDESQRVKAVRVKVIHKSNHLFRAEIKGKGGTFTKAITYIEYLMQLKNKIAIN